MWGLPGWLQAAEAVAALAGIALACCRQYRKRLSRKARKGKVAGMKCAGAVSWQCHCNGGCPGACQCPQCRAVSRTAWRGMTCPGPSSPGCSCAGNCGGSSHCLCRPCAIAFLTESGPRPPAPVKPVRPSRPQNAGMAGFDEKSAEFGFAVGSVRGIRQWNFEVGDALHQAVNGDEHPDGRLLHAPGASRLLRGVNNYTWQPGVNEAVCSNYKDHVPPVEYDEVRRQQCGCITPWTRVLTAGLEWAMAGDLTEGDRLLAFDEYPADPGYGHSSGRKYREAVVASTERGPLPCYDLWFSDGTSVRVSADHRWLCYSGQKGAHWVRTDELRAGDVRASHVVKPFDVWNDLTPEGAAGYLAGAFDGEGCLSQHPARYQNRLSFTQVDNPMLAQVERYLKSLNFEYNRNVHIRKAHEYTRADGTPRSDVCILSIDQKPELLRFLGSVRPVRLLDKFQPALLGRLNMSRRVRLVAKQYAGEHEVVKLGTTTGTYFTEAGCSHNCGFWAYWAIDARTWSNKLPVFGVVEGTGRVVIGEKGFRCQKARILALAPGFIVEPRGSSRDYGAGAGYGPLAVRTESHDEESEKVRSRGQAWMAIVLDELGQAYPQSRVFATVKGMLAIFPTGEITE